MGEKQGIFSPKLTELVAEYGKLAERVRACQGAAPAELRRELAALKEECDSRERELRMGASGRLPLAARLCEIQLQYERAERELLDGEYHAAGDEIRAEDMTLVAEFTMDIATSAVRRALAVSIAALLWQSGDKEFRISEE